MKVAIPTESYQINILFLLNNDYIYSSEIVNC